jgi:alditol oxidase
MHEITNWSGNYIYSTNRLTAPASAEELIHYIKKHPRFKVLGTRHCFNSIADSKDELLSLEQLSPEMVISSDRKTVTVTAGIRYGQLAEYLQNKGLALHNLASLPHISVAGACATATHGSGNKNGNLSTAVAAMEFITAAGEVVTLSREKDGEQFLGAVIHLGALGVITKITLDIQPSFEVRQDVYENLSLQQLKHDFDKIMETGYSVSLFTGWQHGTVGEVWVKSKIETGKPIAAVPDFFGAKPATKNLHPIADISAENCTDQMGIPGPWHERLPHFKMGFTPSSGIELQSEYFVSKEDGYRAIKAVEQLHSTITPHLLISEIRTIDADNFWMSPCYKQPSVAIHFTWKQDWPAVSRLLPLIEAQLAPFNAKPHWGKLFTMAPKRINELYPRLPAFRELIKYYDPEGKFSNDFLVRNISGIAI